MVGTVVRTVRQPTSHMYTYFRLLPDSRVAAVNSDLLVCRLTTDIQPGLKMSDLKRASYHQRITVFRPRPSSKTTSQA